MNLLHRRQAGMGRGQYLVRPLWVAALLLAMMALYWLQLVAAQDRVRETVQANAFDMAEQTAHALSLQVDTLARNLDALSRQLAAAWLKEDAEAFNRQVTAGMAMLPSGALAGVLVANADGIVSYFRRGAETADATAATPVSIIDREYFQQHVDAGAAGLHIGIPVQGRISGHWAIPFSRGIWRDGRFLGVMVLSVSAEYLSRALTQIFPGPGDVALVVRDDGHYLARSWRLADVLGRSVPSDRPFLQASGEQRHTYRAVAPIDGIERLYGWHRTPGYPLVVSVGLERDKVMAATNAAIASNRARSALLSLVLLLVAAVVFVLWAQRSRQTEALRQTRERLSLALEGGGLAAWEWRVRICAEPQSTRRFCAEGGEGDTAVVAWRERLHPDDRDRVLEALGAHLNDGDAVFDVEYRFLEADGTERWVAHRGRVVERDADGLPRRMAGTLLDITARKEAEIAEAEIRLRLTKLLDEVPGTVYQYQLEPDGASFFPYASSGVKRIYDVGPEDIRDSAEPVFRRLYPHDQTRVWESILQSAQSLQPWQAEYRVVHGDGRLRWVQGHANPERLATGATLWHGYIHDVTEEHSTAEALKASEAHLRLAMAAVRDGLWSFDHAAQRLHWDQRILEMLEYADDQATQTIEAFFGLVHPADLDRVRTTLAEAVRSFDQRVVHIDYRLRTAKGEWLWVRSRGRIIEWGSDGAAYRSIGMLSDIHTEVAEAQLRDALLNRNAVATMLVRPDRQLVEANHEFKALFLPSGKELRQLKLRDIHLDEAHWESFGTAYDDLRRAGTVRLEFPFCDVRGEVRWFDLHGTLRDPEDPGSDVIWTLVDISDRHAADAALAVERLRLDTLLRRFPGGVLIEDSTDVVVFVNASWCRLLGLDLQPADLEGLAHSELRTKLDPRYSAWLSGEPTTGPGGAVRAEITTPEGRHLEVDHVEIRRGREYLGVVWFLYDMTERKRKELEMARLASTDSLTGLPNRRSFMARLEQTLQDPERRPEVPGVLLMLDIDHFKRVNDSYGHAGGDAVLRQMTAVARQELRGSDMAGRLGGEEFVFLLPDIDLAAGLAVAERIRLRIEDCVFTTDNESLRITVSLGVAALEAEDLETMLRWVDEAMYAAKQSGRNRVCAWPLQ
ncbi:MAG: PAS domain-containing protein [Pigmentiphaga sp.]|nr:PAS domain-containing protein [Pigmentiphaga sp.]